jgi:hypothetical protein
MARKGLGSLLDDVAEDSAQPVPATPEPAMAASSGNLPVPSADWSKALQEIERINSGLNSLVGSMEASRMLFRQAAEKIDNINLNFEEAEKVLQNYKTAMAELSERFERITNTANKFTIYAQLDDKSAQMVVAAHNDLVSCVTKQWSDFAAAQEKWINTQKEEIKSIQKAGNGVWLNETKVGIYIVLMIMFPTFFGLVIYANCTIVHSSGLTKLLWICGLTFAAVMGAVIYCSRKGT